MRKLKGWEQVRRNLYIIVLLLCFGLIGCSMNQNSLQTQTVESQAQQLSSVTVSESFKNSSSGSAVLSVDQAKTVLCDFLTARTLYLKCLVTYAVYDNSPTDAKIFEIWKQGNWFRSDEYEGNSVKFRVIADEQQVTQYSIGKNTSYEPVMPAAYYNDFYQWDCDKANGGTIGPDGKYVILTIDNVDKFYKKDSAQAGYYYTKIEFGVDNERVIYITLYGNSSYGERPQAINAVTQTYEIVSLNEKFDSAVFAAPF